MSLKQIDPGFRRDVQLHVSTASPSIHVFFTTTHVAFLLQTLGNSCPPPPPMLPSPKKPFDLQKHASPKIRPQIVPQHLTGVSQSTAFLSFYQFPALPPSTSVSQTFTPYLLWNFNLKFVFHLHFRFLFHFY